MTGSSWDASVFDRLYAEAEDPWNFTTSDYEFRKYDATMAALPRERFGNALEIGCSIGVLTARLAGRCDALLALDLAEAAVERARTRCAALPNVTIRQAAIPAGWPAAAPFDLIVFSEVLYFLSREDVAAAASLARASLAPGGHVLLVNWTGPTNTPTTGDEAATLFAASFRLVQAARAETYRIDLLAM